MNGFGPDRAHCGHARPDVNGFETGSSDRRRQSLAREAGARTSCSLSLKRPALPIMMPDMRTTLTLEPDVEQLLRQEMRRTDRSMKAVVNEALRLGLGARGKPPRPPRYRVEPHAFGSRPGVDRDRLNQLVDEMEAEEFADRHDR